MISEEQVSHTAYLARLSLTGDEVKVVAQQLSSVLKHFEQVAKVPTDGVEPLVPPTDVEEVWREDKAVPWENADAAMKNAPEAVGNLFKVPPVVG